MKIKRTDIENLEKETIEDTENEFWEYITFSKDSIYDLEKDSDSFSGTELDNIVREVIIFMYNKIKKEG